MTHEIYLDSAATTRALPAVVERVRDVLERAYGNPSSLHSKGLEAERILKEARRQVALALGAEPREIYFTSGGTEGNNLGIKGAARSRVRRGNHIVTTSIEHSSVLTACRDLEAEGFRITYVPPSSDGLIEPQTVAAAVEPETTVVSVMSVNNEVGAIQPVQAIGRAVRRVREDVIFHVDGVQGFIKVPISPVRMGVDLFTLSGHKLHAPKGVGAIYVRRGVKLQPLFGRGEHEGGLRSGTENVPGIAGLGVAVETLLAEGEAYPKHLATLKSRFNSEIAKMPDVFLNGPRGADGAGHIVNLSIPGVRGEVLLHALSARGVFVSTGSACSSKRGEASHVLEAMDLERDRLESSIRVSFSYLSTEEEVLQGAAILRDVLSELRSDKRP